MKGAFWSFAHRRYQVRKPSLLFEIAMFLWGGLFLVVYLLSFVSDWVRTTNYIGGMLFFLVPIALGLMHRRIRIERAKGADALYRKWLATNR